MTMDGDYSDFSDPEELSIVEELLQQVDSFYSDEERRTFVIADIEDIEIPAGLLLPASQSSVHTENTSVKRDGSQETRPEAESSETEPRETRLKDAQSETHPEGEPQTRPAQAGGADSPAIEGPPTCPEEDTRSPLERFRKPPKKAFSVTDLVSPAWCELQYFYTLSKHGRKRRTPAMKQGTKVHQALEDEIHQTVPVDVQTKEDGWGLRLWNIIQGLQTLQQTGRTRELEVWGTVGGEIVNGVIDEISYDCPDPSLEDRATKPPNLPEGQVRITDLLGSASQYEGGRSLAAALGPQKKRIYITDIKTRQSTRLPSPNAMKPAILQLHLYHHMLENMAQGNLALDKLRERYGFGVDEQFSESFIADIGRINEKDSEHNTIASLWSYMIQTFQEIFLLPTDDVPTSTPLSLSELVHEPLPTRLSPILTVEYLSARYQHVNGEATSKHSLGSKSFLFHAEYLKSYVEESLTWWRGERAAQGVELQEAWKCRSCDFRHDCQWIHDRDNAALQEALARKTLRQEAFKDTKSKV